MNLEEVRDLIDSMTVEELKNLTRDELMFIVSDMNEDDRTKFFIEKNIKIFGDVNLYINDFLQKTNLNSMTHSVRIGIRKMLNRILTYPGITEENKNRVEGAVRRTMIESAPAAGGKSTFKKSSAKRTGKQRKTRRKAHFELIKYNY